MSFVRQDAVEQIAEQVAELVEARRHVEEYQLWTAARHRKTLNHVTDHGSLLDQLRAKLPPTNGNGEDENPITAASAASRPPLAIDALDVLLRIEAASAEWTSVRLRRDLRETVEDNLRLLVGASTRMEDDELRALARDVRRWHGWAATLTGWQSPPWRPRVACPLCSASDALRVNLADKHALCMHCGEHWDSTDGSIVLLADYIRQTDQREEIRMWQAACDHSWRLTVVSPLGISARCVMCHAMETRRVWPRGTPAWTDLDERIRGASA